jgi:hypothetical protein
MAPRMPEIPSTPILTAQSPRSAGGQHKFTSRSERGFTVEQYDEDDPVKLMRNLNVCCNTSVTVDDVLGVLGTGERAVACWS